jgi:F-type H+-transporting ATPase subunit delta
MTSNPKPVPNGGPDREPLHPTVFDISTQRIARVYAEALLRAADKRGQAEEVLEELESLVQDVFTASPELENLFSSASIGRTAREELIRKVFTGRASELVLNLLLVLNDHDRLSELRAIVAACRELRDQRAGRLQVQVRSAVPLRDDQRQRLLEQLRETFHKEPVLQTQVDPELLGGMVVRVGDWLYDQSVRTQLDNLRHQIIERSSYEIQSRRDRFSSPV